MSRQYPGVILHSLNTGKLRKIFLTMAEALPYSDNEEHQGKKRYYHVDKFLTAEGVREWRKMVEANTIKKTSLIDLAMRAV